jgi:tetratricopeptide (TPR) repeat protein
MPDPCREPTVDFAHTLLDPAARRVAPEGLALHLLPERYALEQEVGRGGMGLVVRVHDKVLDRPLALKVLHERYKGRPDLARRFLDEARIVGLLQHPGVAPIHDLGQLADGRPFFAMKLVRGQTLAELLAGRPDPIADLPRFLHHFEQVAQTVAFAHSLGVIHRDLKPSNVMVGAFGEVQVMDWGLAKVLRSQGAGPPPAEPAPADASGAPEAVTQAGAVLGTPAYVAPEQARGEPVGQRADVFGLGAILCQILTGLPPFVGPDSSAMLSQARNADLGGAFARLDQCGADPEMAALARRCLAADAGQRPADAAVVAREVAERRAAVERRLREAERERAAAEVRAEQARAVAKAERGLRRRTVGLAAALLLLVVVGGATGGWWLRQRERAVRAAEATLAEATSLREQEQYAASLAAVDRAELLLPAAAPADLRRRLRLARRDSEMAGRLEAIRVGRADQMQKDHFGFEPIETGYEKAFKEYGLDVGAEPAEVAAQIGRSAIRDLLLVALDEWARARLETDREAALRLMVIAIRADPDPWRNAARHPETWMDRERLVELSRRPEALDQPPSCLALLADALGRLADSPEAAVDLLRRAQRKHPENFWLNHETAFYLQRLTPPRPAEALGFYRAALALRPNSPGVHHNLGRALLVLDRAAEAEGYFRRAIDLQPDYAFAHNNLGAALMSLGRHDEAEKHVRKAIECNPDNPKAHGNLALLLKRRDDVAGAITCYRKIIDLEPRQPEAYQLLGDAHRDRGEMRQAVAAWRQAAVLRPDDPRMLSNLGLMLSEQGEQQEAIAALDVALCLDPEDPVASKNRGVVRARRGDLDGAIEDYRRALHYRPHDGQAWSNLAGALVVRGELHKAREAGRLAVRIAPKDADGHYNLGLALAALNEPVQALHSFRQAAQIRPKRADAFQKMTLTLTHLGRWKEAAEAGEKALALEPGDARTRADVGLAMLQLGRLVEAEEQLKRSVSLNPNLAVAQSNLGIVRMRQGRWAEAERHLRQSVRLDPGAANARCDLGTVLLKRGRPREAADHLRRVTKLSPKFVDAYLDLGRALRACADFDGSVRELKRGQGLLAEDGEQYKEFAQEVGHSAGLRQAEADLPGVLRGEAEPTGGSELLMLAQLCRVYRKRYAAAVRFYADAFDTQELLGALPLGPRYNAACCAALALSGEGIDAAKLDERARDRLRRLARRWLKGELELTQQLVANEPAQREAMRQRLAAWLEDEMLAGVRAGAALAGMPEPERQAWKKLWAEVRRVAGELGERKK